MPVVIDAVHQVRELLPVSTDLNWFAICPDSTEDEVTERDRSWDGTITEDGDEVAIILCGRD